MKERITTPISLKIAGNLLTYKHDKAVTITLPTSSDNIFTVGTIITAVELTKKEAQ